MLQLKTVSYYVYISSDVFSVSFRYIVLIYIFIRSEYILKFVPFVFKKIIAIYIKIITGISNNCQTFNVLSIR